MAPAVLRAVAQAKVAQTVQPTAKPSGLKALPKQASRMAAVLLANAGAASMSFAEEGLSLPEITLPSVDASAVSDATSLFADNPFLIGGLAALVAIPVGVTALVKSNSGSGTGLKPTSVAKTIQALEEDPRVVLVDIRSRAEIKEQGAPNLKSIKRTAATLPYTTLVKGEFVVEEAFAEKFSKLKGISEESLVILMDADGSEAKAAAAEIADSVEKIYFVQGGAAAWSEEGPWRAPSSGFSLPSFDLKSVGASINELADDFKKAPSLTKAGIATGALVGASVLLFNEVEVVLELAGLYAAGNFLLKLVFAEEREKTLSEIKTLVDEKVAIKEVGSDFSKIAKAVLDDVPADATPSAKKPAAAAAAVEASAAVPDKPENVKEAKEWIDNWKEKAV